MLLCLDIGFGNMGWSVFNKGRLQACGVIKTTKTKKKMVRVADDNAVRCAYIARELSEIISTYKVKGVVGEAPSGGSQNASAAVKMALAMGTAVGVFESRNIPAEWYTPGDIKKAAVGRATGTKHEIMMVVAERLGLKVEKKKIKAPRSKLGYRIDYRFHAVGRKWPGGTFEHIADSICAYWAANTGVLVKMFG